MHNAFKEAAAEDANGGDETEAPQEKVDVVLPVTHISEIRWATMHNTFLSPPCAKIRTILQYYKI